MMGAVPRIAQETIERIAAANDIVEVIQSYMPLKRAGTVWKALCPFHSEKSPSFTVDPRRQTYHCFGCGAHGTVFKFLMEYDSMTFVDAVRRLGERAGIVVEEEASSEEEDARQVLRKRLLSLHADTAAWFHQMLLRDRAAGVARDYLKSRGIGIEVAKSWRLGYAPAGRNDLMGHLVGGKFTDSEMVASGLISRSEEDGGGIYARFRDRLMFPISNDRGEVIAFSGRILDLAAKGGKYVNSPETPLFTKGSVLFGLDRSKRAILDADAAIVCEGQLDLITAFEAGVANVIAPQGTAFTEQQARLLRRFARTVVLCFDADTAGQKAAERSFESLFSEGFIVQVAEMPPGDDPDSLIRREGADAFRERIAGARDFWDYLILNQSRAHDLATHQGRVAVAEALAQPVHLVKDPAMRLSLVDRISSALQFTPQNFNEIVSRLDQRQQRRPVNPEARGAVPRAIRPPLPERAVCWLVCVALGDVASRNFLLEQNWREVLPEVAGGEWLELALTRPVDPASTASVNAFLATLPGDQQDMFSRILGGEVPANSGDTVNTWNALRRIALQSREGAVLAALRGRQMTEDKVLLLQKELLDLRGKLGEITRLLKSGNN